MAGMETPHKLFVGGLPTDIASDELIMVFKTYGEVTKVHLMNPHPRTGMRCAFVYYGTQEAAEDSIKVLNEQYKIREDALAPIQVRWAKDVGGATDGKGKGGAPSDGHKLFVGCLPADVQEDELRMVFGTYGEVMHVHVMQPHPRTGLKCAFVFYNQQDAGEDAIKVLDKQYKIREDANEPIQVRWANKEGEGKGKGKGGLGGWGGGWSDGGSWGGGWNGGGLDKGWNKGGGKSWGNPGWSDGGKGGWQQQSWDGGSGGGGWGSSGSSMGGGFQGDTDASRLYIANLPEDIEDSAVEYVFGTYGKVLKIHLMRGKSMKGCISGFVEFGSPNEASTAITALHEKYEIRPGYGPIIVRNAVAKRGPY